ncbi:MAG: nuclear transport factor 2 family protein [Fimbriimonas sp.]
MSNAELFRRHLNNFAKPVEEQDLTVYADGFVAEFPFAPVDHTRRLEGAEAISRFFSKIPSFSDGFKIGDAVKIVESGDDLVAEYTGSSVFKDTNLPYAQEYVAVAKIQDGKIAHIREYYDPMRVLRALGEIG